MNIERIVVSPTHGRLYVTFWIDDVNAIQLDTIHDENYILKEITPELKQEVIPLLYLHYAPVR